MTDIDTFKSCLKDKAIHLLEDNSHLLKNAIDMYVALELLLESKVLDDVGTPNNRLKLNAWKSAYDAITDINTK